MSPPLPPLSRRGAPCLRHAPRVAALPALLLLAACSNDPLGDGPAPTLQATARVDGTPLAFAGFAWRAASGTGPTYADAHHCDPSRVYARHVSFVFPDAPATGTYVLAPARLGRARPGRDTVYGAFYRTVGGDVGDGYFVPASGARLTVVAYDAAGGYVSGAFEGRWTASAPAAPVLVESGRFSGRVERLAPGAPAPQLRTRCSGG